MVSPPASNADGRRPAGLGVRLSRPPPPRAHGEIPKLDKGPPWKSGRRAAPVRGFESHSLRVVVMTWTEHRSTKPGVLGSTPGVDARECYLPPVRHAWERHLPPERQAHLAVAHQDRAPPFEGGGSTFESCRRGLGGSPASREACQRPCSSTVEHTFGMGEDWVRPPARALLTRSHRPPGRRRDGSAPTCRSVPSVDLSSSRRSSGDRAAAS